MKWYYLALLTWILEIIMFASIILIPVCIYLRDLRDWWDKPFINAYSLYVNERTNRW